MFVVFNIKSKILCDIKLNLEHCDNGHSQR